MSNLPLAPALLLQLQRYRRSGNAHSECLALDDDSSVCGTCPWSSHTYIIYIICTRELRIGEYRFGLEEGVGVGMLWSKQRGRPEPEMDHLSRGRAQKALQSHFGYADRHSR